MKNITRILLVALFAIVFGGALNAQTTDSTQVEQQAAASKSRTKKQPVRKAKSIYDRMYFGGTVGVTIGDYTMLSVYPMVAYKITPKLSLGVKAAYEYVVDKRYTTDYKSSNYGLSVFSRYRIIPALYLHVEYAQMNYELYDMYGQSDRVWVPFLFVGGGYSKSLGNRTWLNFQVLFDVLQNSRSPYTEWSPFISIGIGKGF